MRAATFTSALLIFGLSIHAATPAPTISTAPAQHHAVIVTLAARTPGAKIHYTVDGTAPSAASQVYEAPFLVAANLTVEAAAFGADGVASPAASKTFAPNIPSGTLVWSDEFTRRGNGTPQPDPKVWTYDTGNDGFGNKELETYCAWGSTAAPCNPEAPNVFVGQDGYLHVVARQQASGAITSGRLKTEGLFSFQYGRFEIRARVPEGQGLWPAGWLLGNNAGTVDWPACGEMDVLERINAAKTPDWNEGSIHGPGYVGAVGLGTNYNFPAGQTASEWHTYGMIWSKGSVAYYVDDPAHPYATFTTESIKQFPKAAWPFDDGQSSFILLNLAVGGVWPGPPDSATPFPAEMLVDYVRVYTN